MAEVPHTLVTLVRRRAMDTVLVLVLVWLVAQTIAVGAGS